MSNTTFAWLAVLSIVPIGIPVIFFVSRVIADVILLSARLLL